MNFFYRRPKSVIFRLIKWSLNMLGSNYLLHSCILASPLYRYMHRSHHY